MHVNLDTPYFHSSGKYPFLHPPSVEVQYVQSIFAHYCSGVLVPLFCGVFISQGGATILRKMPMKIEWYLSSIMMVGNDEE